MPHHVQSLKFKNYELMHHLLFLMCRRQSRGNVLKYTNIYDNFISVCRATHYHRKYIHCLKALLTLIALLNTIHPFVFICLDFLYCLLNKISNYNINGLQWIENGTACIVIIAQNMSLSSHSSNNMRVLYHVTNDYQRLLNIKHFDNFMTL